MTVKDYMVTQGVSSSRITTRGFGKSKPIADNKTAEGRAQNRRVEINPDWTLVVFSPRLAGPCGIP